MGGLLLGVLGFLKGFFTCNSPLDVNFFANLADANTSCKGVLTEFRVEVPAFTLVFVTAPFPPGGRCSGSWSTREGGRTGTVCRRYHAGTRS